MINKWMKCSVYVAASTHGFIAKPEGGIEWLLRSEYDDAGKLAGEDFIEQSNTKADHSAKVIVSLLM